MALWKSFAARWRPGMTFIGAFLTLAPTGYLYYWGNLTIYTSSYFLFKGASASNVHSPWVLSSFLIALTLSVPLGGYISPYIGRKTTIMIGILISNICITICFYLIDISFVAFTISFGFLVGFGVGLSYSTLELALEWAQSSSGLLSALIESSWNVGGAVVNELITMHINPQDKTPDLQIGPSKFFSQMDIIERVPGLFLLLGVGLAFVQIIGFCLLREKSCQYRKPWISWTSKESNKGNERSAIMSKVAYNANDSVIQNGPGINLHDDPEAMRASEKYSLKTLLLSKVFITLWITSALCESTILLTSNYYKLVGQTRIQDDHLLTLLGTVTIVTTILTRIVSGVTVDKIGVRKIFIFLFFSLAVLGSFFPLSPLISKWLYFGVTIVFLGFAGALYNCFAPATVILLGIENFTINFGLVWTSSLILNVIAPYVLEHLLVTYGWYVMFQVVAIMCFFGGLAVLRFL